MSGKPSAFGQKILDALTPGESYTMADIRTAIGWRGSGYKGARAIQRALVALRRRGLVEVAPKVKPGSLTRLVGAWRRKAES